MTLVRKNQTERMPGFFDGYLLKNLMDWSETNGYKMAASRPSVNIKESEKGFEVQVAAPGLQKSDFSIMIDKNVLTISATQQAKQEENNEQEKYTVREFSFQSFERSFSLPENAIEEEKIEASYKDGILRLMLPKKEEVKPKVKQIKVG